ncbi:MAG: J domain-containing protein [Prochlorotrichaceae cyanobacterium]
MAQRSQNCLNIADCYRTLGLRSGASHQDIKVAYRRLARQYHPDVNEGDQDSHLKFIEITEAYKHLLEHIPPDATPASTTAGVKIRVDPLGQPSPPDTTWNSHPPSVVQFSPELSDMDRRLKQHSYDQLQLLLKAQRFPRAIALVEGLSQRLPQDKEVKQWQAITYQRWGRQLIQDRQYDKARVYLKKALKTDPHNRALWAEVEREFQRLEKVY